jgi:hypothetical protein
MTPRLLHGAVSADGGRGAVTDAGAARDDVGCTDR